MVPETIIKQSDVDAEEIISRLESCLGYLSGRAASALNDPESTAKLQAIAKAVRECQRRIRQIAPCRIVRTESTGGNR